MSQERVLAVALLCLLPPLSLRELLLLKLLLLPLLLLVMIILVLARARISQVH